MAAIEIMNSHHKVIQTEKHKFSHQRERFEVWSKEIHILIRDFPYAPSDIITKENIHFVNWNLFGLTDE